MPSSRTWSILSSRKRLDKPPASSSGSREGLLAIGPMSASRRQFRQRESHAMTLKAADHKENANFVGLSTRKLWERGKSEGVDGQSRRAAEESLTLRHNTLRWQGCRSDLKYSNLSPVIYGHTGAGSRIRSVNLTWWISIQIFFELPMTRPCRGQI